MKENIFETAWEDDIIKKIVLGAHHFSVIYNWHKFESNLMLCLLITRQTKKRLQNFVGVISRGRRLQSKKVTENKFIYV